LSGGPSGVPTPGEGRRPIQTTAETIAFPDPDLARALFGERGGHLKLIEKELDLRLHCLELRPTVLGAGNTVFLQLFAEAGHFLKIRSHYRLPIIPSLFRDTPKA